MERCTCVFFTGLLLLGGIMLMDHPAVLADSVSDGIPPIVFFERMAVAPVLVAQRQPNVDEALDDTLSCPIDQICVNNPSMPSHAGSMVMRLVHSYLEDRFGEHVVSLDSVQTAYTSIRLDGSKDSPRTLALRLGKIVSADLMVIGTLWRYRDRGALEGFPDKPASVAFAIYIVESYSGRMLWRGIFDEAQDFALKDMAKFKDRIKMGFKWLSADELAAHGVKEVFRPFPDTIQPRLSKADQ